MDVTNFTPPPMPEKPVKEAASAKTLSIESLETMIRHVLKFYESGYNDDDYYAGVRNGLKFCLSCIDGKDASYE